MIPDSIRIASPTGSYAIIHPFGARLLELWVPNAHHELVNVALGYADIDTYKAFPEDLIGATVGRIAGRVNKGHFEENNFAVNLEQNDSGHHLHGGGNNALDRVVWTVTFQTEADVTFTYTCPAGTNGYPGNLRVNATYSLSEHSTLAVAYSATSDAACPLNLTHHSYWNLSGNNAETIGSHLLRVSSDEYLETIANTPTGKVLPTVNTELDFSEFSKLDTRNWLELDHLFLLTGNSPQITLKHVMTGIQLDVITMEPAVQIYAGKFLPTNAMTGDALVGPGRGIAIEPQHVNERLSGRETTHTALLLPGEIYLNKIWYRLTSS
jgi:aldose 1-epimerase